MSNVFDASIGRKLIMSITGLFLILFLLVHLSINIFLLFGSDAYNMAAHFMATNPLIRIVEPTLAIGFLVHIIYASLITLKNQKARPERYAVTNSGNSSTWSSRNMYILGFTVLVFLVIHLLDFYIKIKVIDDGTVKDTIVNGIKMHDTYALVQAKFEIWWFDLIYVIGAISLGLHLGHGFWSAFQSIGLNNTIWIARLKFLSIIYAYLIAIGFSIIPIYFLIF